MVTALLATLLAILLGHAVPDLARLRGYQWFQSWISGCNERLTETRFWQGSAALLLTIGLPVAATAFLQWLLHDTGWGIPSFLLASSMLFYCWGPRDLDLEVESIRESSDREGRLLALQRLPEELPSPPLRMQAVDVVDQVFLAALARWFGVLFWFLLLGACGALLYRLTCLADGSKTYRDLLSHEQGAAARTLHRMLDWPAAQLMTLALALAADFDAVITAWRDFHGQRVPGWYSAEPGYLTAAARASVDLEAESDAESSIEAAALLAMQQAMSLVWRVLIVWLAALSVFVLAGKIG